MRHAIGLALLVLLTVAGNAAWVAADNLPPMDDDNTHVITVIEAGRRLAEAETFDQTLRSVLMWHYLYPPAGYYPAAFLFAGTPPSVDAAIATLGVFVALLIVACFAAGWRAGGALAAWLSALGAATCPLALYFSRVYFVDLPVTAFVAAAFAALLWSDCMRRRGFVVLAGLFAGLAMLVKPAAFPMLAGPALALAVMAWRRREIRAWELAANLAVIAISVGTAYAIAARIAQYSDAAAHVLPIVVFSVLLAFELAFIGELLSFSTSRPAAGGLSLYAAGAVLVSGAWYMGNVRAAWEKWRVQDRAFELGGFSPAGAALLTLRDLGGMLWLAGPLILIGIVLALKRRKAPEALWASLVAMALLVWWCAKSGWADRYVLIALPFVAVSATWWLQEATPRPRAILSAIIALGWAWQSVGGWVMDAGIARNAPEFTRAGGLWSAIPRAAPPPLRDPFPLAEMLGLIDPKATVLVMNDHDRGLQTRTMVLYELMAPRGLRFLQEGGEPATSPDYVLMANYDPSLMDLWQIQLQQQHKGVRLLAERAFPRNLLVRLYRVPISKTASERSL